MVFLVGLLDLIGAYETLQEFLAPGAPGDVLKTIDTLQQETSKGTSVVAFVVGAAGAIWAASGAMGAVIKAVNRAYDRVETRPFWKTRIIAIVLVALTGLVLAGLLLLIIFGGPLGTAIADKAHLGGAFELLWAVCAGRSRSSRFCSSSGSSTTWPRMSTCELDMGHPGLARGHRRLARALRPLRALHELLRHLFETYGTLASGIVLLLWLNYSAFALLFGAELNSELERQAEIHAAGGENAGLSSRAGGSSLTCDRALDLLGLRSEKKRSAPGSELHLPGQRAGAAKPDARLTPLPRVGVVDLRAVADDDRVAARGEPAERLAGRVAERDRRVGPTVSSSRLTVGAGGGGGGGGGGLPATNGLHPVECGSQTNCTGRRRASRSTSPRRSPRPA